MTKDEALKLALEALKYPLNQSHENFNVDMAELLAHRAITATKEALMSVPDGAQPSVNVEQEPVAFICEFYADEGHPFVSFEPVTHGTNTPLYITPPQRKPLTDEEIENLYFDKFSMGELKAFARAIEAAHGIKELKEYKK